MCTLKQNNPKIYVDIYMYICVYIYIHVCTPKNVTMKSLRLLDVTFKNHQELVQRQQRQSEGTRKALGHLGTRRALRRHSQGTWALGYSGTWTLGHLRHLGTETLRELRHSGTRALKTLRHLSTHVLRHLGHLGTRALEHSRHLDTRGTLFSRLPYWICDDKRFEVPKNLQCKFFVLYFQKHEWIL